MRLTRWIIGAWVHDIARMGDGGMDWGGHVRYVHSTLLLLYLITFYPSLLVQRYTCTQQSLGAGRWKSHRRFSATEEWSEID
jgi:hypothetical protein